jgi:small subunit ribosomal protein S16
LARGGTHKRPFYSIVIAHKTSSRDGKFIERIGHYDPLLKDNKSTVDTDKAQQWLSKGARPTDRVVKLLKLHGIDVPENMRDHEAHSPAKKKALEQRAGERKEKDEGKAKQAAARAAAKEAAKTAEGGAQPAAE